tara:strand:+ start:2050 stop:2307 length:258 start_codon:yes stop_codon:yes gene_type:complete
MYLEPTFVYNKDEKLTMGFLLADDEGNIDGFTERKIIGANAEEDEIDEMKFTKGSRERLPLCKAGGNKYWVLKDDGKIVKEYINQ